MKSEKTGSRILTVLQKTLPVMAGYVVLGTGFGLLMQVNGYGVVYSLLMSLFIYAGSLQYAGVGLLTGGASLLTVAVTSLVINARHLFYGITMIGPYRKAGAKKLYLMHSLTDETYSLVCNEDVPACYRDDPQRYYFMVSLFNQSYWVLGSLIGALLGQVIPWDMRGLDFSMTALFVTVVTEQWVKEKEHRPAIIGLAASVLCILLFGRENFIVPSMVLIIISLSLLRRSIGGKKAGEKA